MNFSIEAFEALPYETQLAEARGYIDAVLENIRGQGREPYRGEYANLFDAMACFAEASFAIAIDFAARANHIGPGNQMRTPGLSPEPDYSVPVSEVWARAQQTLAENGPDDKQSS
ncbi:hypothetical protein G3A43_07130 [Paraburkholderia aspalathi]|nr:hypothetical protein [Paraburkholderia aspalathi]MBK3780025.1 hypothetical protein [Paraburkholderia aspalathi]